MDALQWWHWDSCFCCDLSIGMVVLKLLHEVGIAALVWLFWNGCSGTAAEGLVSWGVAIGRCIGMILVAGCCNDFASLCCEFCAMASLWWKSRDGFMVTVVSLVNFMPVWRVDYLFLSTNSDHDSPFCILQTTVWLQHQMSSFIFHIDNSLPSKSSKCGCVMLTCVMLVLGLMSLTICWLMMLLCFCNMMTAVRGWLHCCGSTGMAALGWLHLNAWIEIVAGLWRDECILLGCSVRMAALEWFC